MQIKKDFYRQITHAGDSPSPSFKVFLEIEGSSSFIFSKGFNDT
jgi:hypothetical protein